MDNRETERAVIWVIAGFLTLGGNWLAGERALRRTRGLHNLRKALDDHSGASPRGRARARQDAKDAIVEIRKQDDHSFSVQGRKFLKSIWRQVRRKNPKTGKVTVHEQRYHMKPEIVKSAPKRKPAARKRGLGLKVVPKNQQWTEI